MTGRNGQELLSAWVPADVADRFKAWARGREGGTSAELRRMVTEAVDGVAPSPPPGSSGYRVTVRLKDADRFALLRVAKARATTPANWLRSLAIVHLGRRPQWSEVEAAALREIGMEVRRIGNNVNQIAKALNTAVHAGEYPAHQGEAIKGAVQDIRSELRRVVAIYSGNFDYWGLPDADRPTAMPGMEDRERARFDADKLRRHLRPRRRPAKFVEDDREVGRE